MSSLGIYFGPKVINIVETKGKRVLNSIQISRAVLSTAELAEKVPEEIKIVALFKDELRRNKIEAKEATLCLSGKDLIIRTFEMPVLPANELPGAVNFEARKYIPFKVEDLVSDFQTDIDKISRRNQVLFVGIKKETLDKYTSILDQLEIKINAIEYSAFSLLRFLKLSGLGDRGVIGIFSADFRGEDEVNFTVLQDGFPLFSRDISLISEHEELLKTEEIGTEKILDKLKTEIRISLDYYHRKLPTKKIEKMFLISEEDYRMDLETFMQELGFPIQFIEVNKYIGRPAAFNLGFIKGYACSLSKVIKTSLKIKLLARKAEVLTLREAGIFPEEVSIFTGLRIEPWAAILGALICLGFFLFGLYRKLPLQGQLNEIIAMRPGVSTINPQASYEELTGIDLDYKKRIDILGNLIRKEFYLTEVLDAIPRIIPEGMWLVDLSFKKEVKTVELRLRGATYLADNRKEIELVHTFLSNLKANPTFAKHFKDMVVNSIEQGQAEGTTVTNFVISCRSSYEERE